MALSVFDLFKIGIGPSSSHTVGPMRAARQFALRLQERGLVNRVARISAMLYGSLGATGKGHGSDKAVLLGLCGHEPDSVDVNAIAGIIEKIRTTHQLPLLGAHPIAFDEKRDLVFNHRDTLPLHSNGMLFTAFDSAGAELASGTFYSVGGGFVVSDEPAPGGGTEKKIVPNLTTLPHPFRSGDELLELCVREGKSIAGIMRINERSWRTDEQIDAGLLNIWHVMQACVKRGC
jgi:L-serine dehydratase